VETLDPRCPKCETSIRQLAGVQAMTEVENEPLIRTLLYCCPGCGLVLGVESHPSEWLTRRRTMLDRIAELERKVGIDPHREDRRGGQGPYFR
jgi:uncharacterized protein with PIN domain